MSAPFADDTTPHAWWCVASAWLPPAVVALAGYDLAGSLGLLPWSAFLERSYLLASLGPLVALAGLVWPVGCSRPVCTGPGWLGRRLYAHSWWMQRHAKALDILVIGFLGYVIGVVVLFALSRVAVDAAAALAAGLVGLPGYSARHRRAVQEAITQWRP
jgi:hypothetical protein